MENNLKSLDLTNLREITLGNSETEALLFPAFIDVAAKAIINLQKSLEKNQETLWHEQAHFLRGSSANIGARRLAFLCGVAEEKYQTDKAEKLLLLKNIEEEFRLVKGLLEAEKKSS